MDASGPVAAASPKRHGGCPSTSPRPPAPHRAWRQTHRGRRIVTWQSTPEPGAGHDTSHAHNASAGMASAAVLALVLASGAACHTSSATDPSHGSGDGNRVRSHPSIESAWRLCRTAVGQDGTVLSAHRTTVDQVRQHRGGPPLGISPAEQPWSSLPGDAMAAWCAVRAGFRLHGQCREPACARRRLHDLVHTT